MCGPPGLGKTTLAHILAKHAGYRPVEINARLEEQDHICVDLHMIFDLFSDDRSADTLKDKIRNATGIYHHHTDFTHTNFVLFA